MKQFFLFLLVIFVCVLIFGLDGKSTYGKTHCYKVQTSTGIVEFESEMGEEEYQVGETINRDAIYGTVTSKKNCSVLLNDGV